MVENKQRVTEKHSHVFELFFIDPLKEKLYSASWAFDSSPLF